MKAQVINAFGDVSVFESTELPTPHLIPGHVLIKVYATSVNQIDCKIRSGAVGGIGPAFPAILQGDVAGVIEAVAEDVKAFKVGDEVYGCAGGFKSTQGALAEYMLADQQLIAKKPHSYSMRQAAALPLVGITAWQGLYKKVQIQKDQTVLIHGGVGGVGHVAVQLAHAQGCRVFTTVMSNADVALAKKLGADEVILVKEEPVENYLQRLTDNKGFAIVFDTVGGPNLDKSLQAAMIEGHVITTAARSTHDLSPMHNKALNLHVIFMLLPIINNQHRAELGEILKKLAVLADEGKVVPLIDEREFSLSQVGEAHAYLESGKAKGKVVITI